MKKHLLYTLLGLVAAISATSVFGQAAGLANPVITEIMYNPPESGNDTLEFLEIYNPNLSTPYDLGGASFTSGIEYTFPIGYSIAADSYVLISGDSVIFEEAYGLESFEWTGGTALNNDGEGVALRSSNGFLLDTVFYDDTNDWADADATGYSLVLCNPSADNSLPENWTLSENLLGFTVNSLAIYADPNAASTCTVTGIADDNLITTLIYPNPTEGEFAVRFSSIEKSGILNVYNSLGQVIYTEALTVGTTSTTVDSNLESGFYVVSLNVGDSVEQHRLIVE